MDLGFLRWGMGFLCKMDVAFTCLRMGGALERTVKGLLSILCHNLLDVLS